MVHTKKHTGVSHIQVLSFFTLCTLLVSSLDSGLSANSVFATSVPAVVGVIVYPTEALSISASKNVPTTFAQIFKQGDIPAGQYLDLRNSNTTSLPYQVDAKATYPDGSLKHAVISTLIPEVSSQGNTLEMYPTTLPTSKSLVKISDILSKGYNARVNLTLASGTKYHASVSEAYAKKGVKLTWLAGPVVNEWELFMPFVSDAGIEHPHLTARFSVRAYTNGSIKSDVTIENNWTYEPAPSNFTYDVSIMDSIGKVIYTKPAFLHYSHSRWRTTFWDKGADPKVDVKFDTNYLIATKAIPNYDRSVPLSTAQINTNYTNIVTNGSDPMGKGMNTYTAMGTTGGRAEIGLETAFSSLYILSQDPKAKATILKGAELGGAWPVHYRDKNTDDVVSINDYPYLGLFGTLGDSRNPITKKYEQAPACATSTGCKSILQPDSAHQPSFAFVPYLVTGDYYFLEELKFWGNYDLINNNPWYRLLDKGIMKSEQVRGVAWTIRTIGQAAFILPDSDTKKAYFSDKIKNNIDYLNQNLTDNPGAPPLGWTNIGYGGGLGYLNSSGQNTGMSPWMDHFVTQSIGYMNDLGFSGADRLLKWKAKFPTGLMNTSDTCWLFATTYSMNVKATATGSLFTTFKQMYDDTVGNTKNASGALLKDQPCISAQMQAWRPTIYGRTVGLREMVGYPSESTGYGANMQPALAYAVDSGYPGAKESWAIYETRDPTQVNTLGYGSGPQFSIVPRSIPQTSIKNGLSIVINHPELTNPNPINPPVTPPVTPPTSPNIPPTTPPNIPPVVSVPLRQLLLIKGDRSEVSGITQNATVTPAVNIQGLTGTVGIKGTGFIAFTGALSGDGVLFGKGGQQNTNTAYYELKGEKLGSLFNPENTEINFTLKSSYSFKERAALPSYNYRTAFDVLDANGASVFKLQSYASNRLIFYFTIGGKAQYYYVPAGQEDTMFGKNKFLTIRMVSSGTNHELYLNGTRVWNLTFVNTSPIWDTSSVLVIGAAGHKSYGSGYFSSDDAIDEFSVSGK